MTPTRSVRWCHFLLAGATTCIGCSSARPSSPAGDTVELRGVVRDRDGTGVRDVLVSLDPLCDGRSLWISAPTNRKGEYLHLVPRGAYRWRLDTSFNRVPRVDLDTILLSGPRERLDYRYGGVRIRGRVTGPRGEPLEAGSVMASGIDAAGREIVLSGEVEGGRYQMFLPPSTYSLHFEPRPRRYPNQRHFGIPIAGDTTIDFRVEGHRVRGSVTVSGSRRLRAARVVARRMTKENPLEAWDRTSRDGRFELYLPTGSYGFLVVPEHQDEFVAPQLFHREVSGPHSLDLTLHGVRWSGVVRDSATDQGVPRVEVTASGWHTPGSARTKTDHHGRFELLVRRGERYQLVAQMKHRALWHREVEAGEDSSLTLHVHAGRAETR
jgi:hypothetical protein